ncbi:hypothetical protein UlMin_033760 [Ulmus minor]
MAFAPTSLLLKHLFIYIIIASGAISSEGARIFTIVNYCNETIWPAITHSENFSGGGGFTLKPGQSTVYTAPANWNGRIWARTGCNFDKNGNGSCQTGSCGNVLNCTGPGSPPASIAEFTLGDLDFYDVSLVDGFNLPIVVKATNGKGNCSNAGCDGDLRQSCPSELQAKGAGRVFACRSACDVFNTDEYCCRGMFGNPVTCVATNYSMTFKQFCPAAYSFAYDDPTSILTCSSADFTLSFCGSRNQTVCTYHDNQIVCNGSKTLKAISHRRWLLMLALHLVLIFHTRL